MGPGPHPNACNLYIVQAHNSSYISQAFCLLSSVIPGILGLAWDVGRGAWGQG